MANNTTEKMVTLVSSDGEEFLVEETVAKECQTIRNMMEDDCVITKFPLVNVKSKILSKVIEYCRKHVAKAEKAADVAMSETAEEGSSSTPATPKASSEDLEEWDKAFMAVDMNTLYDLILAANYLNAGGLLNLAAQATAAKIMGKSPEEIRKTFNIENDFTPEEEEEIRNANPWAFDMSE